MYIQTVSGPVPLETITMVDAHAHVWITPPKGVAPKFRFELNNPRKIEAELKDFRLAGGTLLVDCQPGGCGRDGRMLQKLAESAELNITATTGFHLEQYYPAEYWLWSASEKAAVDYFVNELTTGLRETDGVLAAIIKIGYWGKIEGQTRILMEAAAEAARVTGAGLLFHTEEGRNVEALPLFFEDRGVASKQLYFCHVDKRPDSGLHQELAQAGVLLGYDTFIRSTYEPDLHVWPLLLEMVQAGYEDSIAIGLDMARSSFWHHFGGGPGLIVLPDGILPRLHHEGLAETVVGKLVGQNVSRFLAHELEGDMESESDTIEESYT